MPGRPFFFCGLGGLYVVDIITATTAAPASPLTSPKGESEESPMEDTLLPPTGRPLCSHD